MQPTSGSEPNRLAGATHRDDLDLARALVHPGVDRRAGVALRGRPAELRREVEVDREEACPGGRLPVRDERLAARVPGGVRRVDAAGVEAARESEPEADGQHTPV